MITHTKLSNVAHSVDLVVRELREDGVSMGDVHGVGNQRRHEATSPQLWNSLHFHCLRFLSADEMKKH